MPEEAASLPSEFQSEEGVRDNPFPGLRSFESDETHLFFGRDGQSDELLRILTRNRFVAVIGVSGSGKSSLVRAGLLPTIERGFMAGAGSNWRILTIRPGATPMANLAAALSQSSALEAADLDIGRRQTLVDAALSRDSFGLIEAARLTRSTSRENLLVLVDQFEEIFRLGSGRLKTADAEDPAAFVRQLLEAIHQTEVPIYVAITMRSDFLGDCARFRDLPETLNRAQYLIPRMNREQRRQAIEGPIAVGDATISSRLVQRLLNDLGDEPDQLPILQHALMRTWDAWYREGKLDSPIDLDHYEGIGGMSDALSRHADEAYAELDEHSKDIARRLFQCISEKGPDNREIRRPTRLSEICAIAEADQESVVKVIDCFRSHGRTFLVPPAHETLGPNSVIDVSHESLIRLWNRLRKWTDEESEDAAIYKRLADDAARNKAGRVGLLRNPGLAATLEWRATRKPNAAWANRYAPGFLAAMEFLEHSRRSSLVRRYTAGSAVALGLLATFGVGWIYSSSAKKVHDTAQAALARQLGYEAQANERDNPEKIELSALLALESNKLAPTMEDDDFLRQVEAISERPQFKLGLPGVVHAVSYSRDGRMLAAAAGETVDLIETATGKVLQSLKSADTLTSVSFSPDGSRLATASYDRSARVFDVSTGKQLWNSAQNGVVLAIAFSPDGRYLTTGGLDKTVRMFDAASGLPIWQQALGDGVGAVAFSGDGRFLATGSLDKTARVFDVLTGKEVRKWPRRSAVSSVGFSPDSRYLAIGCDDGGVVIFDVATSEEKWRFLEGDKINALAFSPDGKFLAVGSADKTARIFETEEGREVFDIKEDGGVDAIAFSPDGRYLATGSEERTARVFDVAAGTELWRLVHSDTVGTVAFSPDGRFLATGSDDKNARLFQMAKNDVAFDTGKDQVTTAVFSPDERFVAILGQTKVGQQFEYATQVFEIPSGKNIRTLRAASPDKQVLAVAFGPQGKEIALGIKDGTTSLIETATGNTIVTLKGNESKVVAVAFSSNGRFVATGSFDLTARVFDAATGAEISKLKHGDVVDAVAFSPDGTLVATGSYDKTARVFEAASGRQLSQFQHDSQVDSVAFSPDGRYVTTGTRGRSDKVHVFEATTGRELWNATQDAEIGDVFFSPDNRYVITVNNDKSARIFEQATGEEDSQLSLPRQILGLSFNLQGSEVVAASAASDRSKIDLESFPLHDSDLAKDVCARLSRGDLTAQEWKQYLPNEPPEKVCPE
jgi:WD40 repeat protein